MSAEVNLKISSRTDSLERISLETRLGPGGASASGTSSSLSLPKFSGSVASESTLMKPTSASGPESFFNGRNTEVIDQTGSTEPVPAAASTNRRYGGCWRFLSSGSGETCQRDDCSKYSRASST
ncbi:MAG: hypothetical protein V9G04_11400 [Nocardioides sp.]